MARIRLVSPWVEYYRKIEAFFRHDPCVRVVYFEEDNILKVYVEDEKKAVALTKLLPSEKIFGNVKLSIEIVPANGKALDGTSTEDLYVDAFKGNEAVSFIQSIPVDIFTNPLTYIVFVPEVVQYFTDDLGDYYGLRSTLYADIAREIFEGSHDGIFFSTDRSIVMVDIEDEDDECEGYTCATSEVIDYKWP